ncbi:MAG: hypothetical protein U9M90_02120 [Patescibacteria group bacterium]|nr:hypothetical protein [Patescibacteria group bacterium]
MLTKNNDQQWNNAQEQKPTFREYVEAVKAAFQRVWLNRYLWFWGIFLPAGAGFSFNFGNGGGGSGDETSVCSEDVFAQVLYFIKEHIILIIVIFAVIIVINIIIWIISAIARSGTIQALHELQEPSKQLTFDFRKVWRYGKRDIGKILLIDIVIMFALMLIILILASPIIFLVASGNFFGAVLIGLVAILVIFPVLIFAGYLKQVSVVFAVLSHQASLRSIEAGCLLALKNIVDTLKILVTTFVLNIIHGLIVFGVIIVLVIVGLVGGVFFGFFLGGYEGFRQIFDNMSEHVGILAAIGIFISIFLFIIFTACLLIKAFFSLWVEDVWIWWVKRLGGVKNVESVTGKEEVEKALKEKVASNANASTNEH